jgi:hypothetical protein
MAQGHPAIGFRFRSRNRILPVAALPSAPEAPALRLE